MCGIHAVITPVEPASALTDISSHLRRRLASRGPDHWGRAATRTTDEKFALQFVSTVLSLRGSHTTEQPFVDKTSGSILCWNGEAWKIDGCVVDGNDGETVFRMLCGSSHAESSEEAVLDSLRSVEGPFAFVYFDRPAGTLFFGRDRLGRRSLLIAEDDRGVVLSSVADTAESTWREVEADAVYVMRLGNSEMKPPAHGRLARIGRRGWIVDSGDDIVSGIGRFNMSVPASVESFSTYTPTPGTLRNRLTEALRLRVLNVPSPPGSKDAGSDIRVAVLFSGGLDCTVLARLCHDILPADQGVDLINVAFENPRVFAQLRRNPGADEIDVYEACPDRITGRKSFSELQSVCPGRAWSFFAVNVPYTETTLHRAEVVSLMYPHNTEMDLSIALALYFAARGVGLRHEHGISSPTVSTTLARVLLSGLGADELFGGYSRHGVAFSRGGYAGLAQELKLDVARLGKRNLGRDDRVMAHWGREVRFPFLDEDLMRWAIGLPVWEKCDFGNSEQGEQTVEPGKRVLRLLAAALGMEQVAGEKKRAIQFGSRTAKMEGSRVKGTTPIA